MATYQSSFTGAQIDATVGGAVRFDVEQTKTNAQKSQAQKNLGMENVIPFINGLVEGYSNYAEGKKISDNTGAIVDAEGFCTTDYIEVTPSVAYTVKTNSVSVTANYLIEYNSAKVAIDYWTCSPNRDFTASANTKYIRFTFNSGYVATVAEKYGDQNNIYTAQAIKSLNERFAEKENAPTGEYSSSDIHLTYNIGNGYHTKGYLKLPSNYSLNGSAVPLIVFVHGSGDMGYMDAPVMTNNYNTYYNYLRDCGYAIFDCYAFGNKYDFDHTEPNTWGIPLNTACYKAGIEYVCENYNIDISKVFVACKSLGGIQALSMFYNADIKILATGMLCPELGVLDVYMGYNATLKRIIAAELGFSEDTDNVLDFGNGDPVPVGFWDYITANVEKWCGHFTEFIGLPIKNSNKPTYYQKLYDTEEMCRASLNRAIKIWVAQDDMTVSYENAVALIASLQNFGYKGELRTMPSGTGGHHSVDNAEDAPQTTNVTTPLGITYATVPTAYYELEQFFRQYL